MRLGSTVRLESSPGRIMRNVGSLLDFMKLFPDLDFFELYCSYPFPLSLMDDVAKIKTFLKNNNQSIGLHFPVEWNDLWMKNVKYDEMRSIIINFANAVEADYVNVHPDDLATFLKNRNDEIIKNELERISALVSCLTVENGHSVYNNPGDLDNFLNIKNVKLCLDFCHVYQSDFEFKDFRHYVDNTFLFHLSDVRERAHLELGAGALPVANIISRLKHTNCYGLLLETLLVQNADSVFRDPAKATRNSISFLRNSVETFV